MDKPKLYIFSGLPGSGKSTLAQELSKATGFTYLRIDTIEQGLRDLCHFKLEAEGYHLSYRIARDNLKLGISVVADSCNPIELTRFEWNKVAIQSNAEFTNIEIICSDPSEHKYRIEHRKSSINGLKLPSWEDVKMRHYDLWSEERIIIDTAGKSIKTSVGELLFALDI